MSEAGGKSKEATGATVRRDQLANIPNVVARVYSLSIFQHPLSSFVRMNDIPSYTANEQSTQQDFINWYDNFGYLTSESYYGSALHVLCDATNPL